MIDESTDLGQRAARHLSDDEVVWLTSVLGEGEAEPASEHAAYIEKDARGLSSLTLTPGQFAQQYSTPVGVRLTKVRGF